MSEQELNEARKRFEEEKLTRRAALRKMGITAGATFFSMFMLNDLARVAASRLDRYRADSKLANDLAHEFHNAGVAFAGPATFSQQCVGPCRYENPSVCGICCNEYYHNECTACCEYFYNSGEEQELQACLARC